MVQKDNHLKAVHSDLNRFETVQKCKGMWQ